MAILELGAVGELEIRSLRWAGASRDGTIGGPKRMRMSFGGAYRGVLHEHANSSISKPQ